MSDETRRIGMWIAIVGGAGLLIMLVLLTVPSHPKGTKPPADAAIARVEVDAAMLADAPLPNADMPDPPKGTRDEWVEANDKPKRITAPARVEFVRTLAGELATNRFPFTVRLGADDHVLEIVSDGCTAKLLDQIEHDVGANMRRVLFHQIACANGRASKEL